MDNKATCEDTSGRIEEIRARHSLVLPGPYWWDTPTGQELVTNAPMDIEYLLGEVERLEGEVAKLTELVESHELGWRGFP